MRLLYHNLATRSHAVAAAVGAAALAVIAATVVSPSTRGVALATRASFVEGY